MNDVHQTRRGRPRKVAERRDADRRILVDAAVDILREGGSTALTVRSVAGRAGTSVGTVYTLFDSLEALRLEANAVTMRLLRDALSAALERCRDDSIEARLLRLADAYLAFAAEHHNAWAAMFERRTIEAPPAIAADIAALFSILEGVLQDAGGADEIPVIARALWSSVHGMVYLGDIGALGPIGPDEIQPMIEALVRTAVRGLAGRAGAPVGDPNAPG